MGATIRGRCRTWQRLVVNERRGRKEGVVVLVLMTGGKEWVGGGSGRRNSDLGWGHATVRAGAWLALAGFVAAASGGGRHLGTYAVHEWSCPRAGGGDKGRGAFQRAGWAWLGLDAPPSSRCQRPATGALHGGRPAKVKEGARAGAVTSTSLPLASAGLGHKAASRGSSGCRARARASSRGGAWGVCF